MRGESETPSSDPSLFLLRTGSHSSILRFKIAAKSEFRSCSKLRLAWRTVNSREFSHKSPLCSISLEWNERASAKTAKNDANKTIRNAVVVAIPRLRSSVGWSVSSLGWLTRRPSFHLTLCVSFLSPTEGERLRKHDVVGASTRLCYLWERISVVENKTF